GSSADESRYVYVGVTLLLPLLAHALAGLSWRPILRPAVATVFGLALLGNIVQLYDRAIVDPVPTLNRNLGMNQAEIMRIERAELQTVAYFRGAPDMALDQPIDPILMPQLNARSYFAAIDQLGSPVPTVNKNTFQNLPADAVD